MILLNNEKLEEVFVRLRKHPHNNDTAMELLALLQPVVKLTLDRLPPDLRDDLEQEIKITVLKKLEYLTMAFLDGKIKDATGYFFRFLRNSAIMYIKKENKQNKHLVSIEDVKVDQVASPRTYAKEKVILKVRAEVLEWLELRFDRKMDFRRAARFVEVILTGKRPKFKNEVIRPFYNGHQITAKEAYSIVLQKIRDSIMSHIDEWKD